MTDATDDARKWAWIAPDGTDGSGPGSELLQALGSGALPPTTLVWCVTWLEWLPANSVGYLSKALPKGAVQKAREPKRAATALAPPPRPAGTGTVVLPRPPDLVRPPLPAPGAAKAENPSSFGTIGRPRGASVLGPRAPHAQSAAPREPLPTLGDDSHDLSDTKATLRPPGAVPPPPRGAPMGPVRTPVRESAETVRKQTTTLGGIGPSRDTLPEITERAPPPTVLNASDIRPAVILPGAPTDVAIHSGPTAPPLTKPAPQGYAAAASDLMKPSATLLGGHGPAPGGYGPAPSSAEAPPTAVDVGPPSTTLESAAPMPIPSEVAASPVAAAPVAASELALERSSRPPVPRLALIGLALLALVVLLLAAGLVTLVVIRLREPVTEVATAPSATASAPPRPVGCELLSPAARLTPAVHRAVPPILAAAASPEQVAVGCAEGPKAAVGLLVDLGTLDATRAFEQAGTENLFAVSPFPVRGAMTFAVDRAGGSIGGARTFAPNLVLGISGVDVVRVASGASSVVWPKAASEKVTDPRVAPGAAGHLVTFRRGGLGGRVLYGFLRPDGTARGDLVAIEAPGLGMSGTPDAALGDDGGLIAFAGRANDKVPWRVQLASIPLSGKATVAAFEPPHGGAGGGSIAPAVTGLGREGWILQWTEGTSGQYQVRVQRLGKNLEPLGEARQVSPKGANAGQGALFAVGSKVLSVFVQTTAGHDELWGASLRCD